MGSAAQKTGDIMQFMEAATVTKTETSGGFPFGDSSPFNSQMPVYAPLPNYSVSSGGGSSGINIKQDYLYAALIFLGVVLIGKKMVVN